MRLGGFKAREDKGLVRLRKRRPFWGCPRSLAHELRGRRSESYRVFGQSLTFYLPVIRVESEVVHL
jgi:hypothetical protein